MSVDLGGCGLKEVVVGRFPPPLGGVSIFVKRKYASIRGDGGECVDLGTSGWLGKLLLMRLKGGRTYYLNTGNVYFLLGCFLLGVLGSSYIYDHNASRSSWGRGFREWIFVFLVRRSRGVRVVHEHLRAGYEERGLGDWVSVESPFLPPDEGERTEIVRRYRRELVEFLESESSFKIFLSASKYAVDGNGRDVYGLDALASLLECLSAESLDFRCLLAVAQFERAQVPAPLLERLDRMASCNRLLVISESNELWPLYERVDLFLRLTSTDGDSVSVRESVYFGCDVIASDVVPRPDGVIVYKYGDQNSLNDLVVNLVRKRTFSSGSLGP